MGQFPITYPQLTAEVRRQIGRPVPELDKLDDIVQNNEAIDDLDLWPALRNALATGDPGFFDDSIYELSEDLPTLGAQILAAAKRVADADQLGDDQLMVDLAAAWLIDQIGHHLLYGFPGAEATFPRMRIRAEARRLEQQLLSLTEAQAEILPMLLIDATLLQGESKIIRGRDIFHFVPSTFKQIEAMKHATRDPQLRNEGIVKRINRAFKGLHAVDGNFTRSDNVVLGLIWLIRGRLEKRRAELQQLKSAVLRATGLDPNTPIQINIYGDSPHLHQLRQMVVRRIARGTMIPDHAVIIDRQD